MQKLGLKARSDELLGDESGFQIDGSWRKRDRFWIGGNGKIGLSKPLKPFYLQLQQYHLPGLRYEMNRTKNGIKREVSEQIIGGRVTKTFFDVALKTFPH